MQGNFDSIYSLLKSLDTMPDVLAIKAAWQTQNNREHYELKGYHSYHLNSSIDLRRNKNKDKPKYLIDEEIFKGDLQEIFDFAHFSSLQQTYRQARIQGVPK